MPKSRKKNVCCLYRTKTFSKVFTPEMEMQRMACHNFVEKQGWLLLREFWQEEAPNDTAALQTDDALLELRAGAIKKRFDVLLVYELDRLGRTPYESPFAAEFFDRRGIEVWTVISGKQDFVEFREWIARVKNSRTGEQSGIFYSCGT